VLSQTHSNIEFIIVNNGSTDNSEDIIAKYLNDDRIVYIKQEDAGPSGARNSGLNTATGNYITFIDSDDWVEPQMYEKMLNALKNTSADIAVCDFNLVYEDGRETKAKYSNTKNEIIDIDTDLYNYLGRCLINPRSNNYIWSRLYRADVIKNIGLRFERLTLGDDTLFNFQLLAHIKKVVFLEDGFYNYLQRSTSIIHSFAKKQPLAGCYASQFDFLADHYKASGNRQLIDSLPIFAYTRMRSVFFYSRLSGMSNDEIIENLKEVFAGRQIAEYLIGL